MGRIGSSRTVEFVVALTFAILAVVGALLCIGFLLIEPQLHPPGRTVDTTSIASQTQSCSARIETVPLPHSCSYNNQQVLERAFCNLGTCDCASSNLEGSVCCCRAIEEATIEGITCNGVGVPPIFINATSCGCAVCDNVAITIRMRVVTSDDLDETIPAAQVLKLDDGNPTLLGITDNVGRFTYEALAGDRNISFKIQAVGYMPKTIPSISLTPTNRFIDLVVRLMPLMNVELGLGGSALTLRLGRMAVVSAPGGAFHTMDGETYEDLVTFRGVAFDEDYAGLPSQNFECEDEEGNMTPFGIIFAAYLEFAGTDFEPLASEQLKLDIALNGGLAEEENLEMFLVALDETTGRWTKVTDFKRQSGGRQKRQQGLVLEANGIPFSTFVSVASFSSIECFVQIRTFGTGTFPDSPYFVTLGLETLSTGLSFRFGTNTGGAQTSSESFQSNAICLPIACNDILSAQIESREFEADTSMSLVPVDFPPGVFDISENAPIAIGTLFSIEEVIPATPTRARPFYDNANDCAANGREPPGQADADADWFEFVILPIIDVPDPQDLCHIKINILDCFSNNTVTVTSIDSTTSVVQNTQVYMVDEDFQQLPVIESGTPEPGTLPPTCNAATATLRGACLSYNCTSIVQVIVGQSADSDRTQLCDLTDRSVILSSPILTDASTDRGLIVATQLLITDDYNNPNLGLYNDPTMADMSLGRCFSGSTTVANEIDIFTGVAATFTCFDPNG